MKVSRLTGELKLTTMEIPSWVPVWMEPIIPERVWRSLSELPLSSVSFERRVFHAVEIRDKSTRRSHVVYVEEGVDVRRWNAAGIVAGVLIPDPDYPLNVLGESEL